MDIIGLNKYHYKYREVLEFLIMIQYSIEQQTIIGAVLEGKNCLVNAVAGSGKTTTVMGIAEKAPEKRIIQITYNRHLKDEVFDKLKLNKKIQMGANIFENKGPEVWEFLPNNRFTKWTIREEPNLSSKIIGNLLPSNKFTVLGQTSEWFQIKYKKIEGWIRWKIPPESDGDYLRNETRYEELVPNKYIDKCFDANVSVYTYHGLCVRFYNRMSYDDTMIEKILLTDKKLSIEIPTFDILVIDETQDMTLLYYKLIRKFIRDYGKKITILLLGDNMQGIYEFKKSDKRFLTCGDKLWSDFGPFLHLSLRTSYRLTNEIGAFVNEIMMNNHHIITQKQGCKVEYIRMNIWDSQQVSKRILNLLVSKQYTPEDIFVLAPSIMSKKGVPLPINALENNLVKMGIQCFTSMNDESVIHKDFSKGKVVFSTFHQAKGRERPIVIVYGFDANWFKYYGKYKDNLVCPNELYVAVTRASERLILIEGTESLPLPFLQHIHIDYDTFRTKHYLDVSGSMYKATGITIIEEEEDDNKHTNPTELLKFIDPDSLPTIIQMKEVIFTKHSDSIKSVDIPTKIKNNIGLSENVSDLNGLAIPMIWETRRKGISSIYQYVAKYSMQVDIIEENFRLLPKEITEPSDFLRLANIYQALISGYHFKLAQICDYSWLTKSMVDDCNSSMTKHFDDSVTFEINIGDIKKETEYGTILMRGRIDALDKYAVYELKCVSELTIEHFLQLVLYAWLWKQKSLETGTSMYEKYGARRFFLINIRTEELHELNTNSTYIDDLFNILIQNKFKKENIMSDYEFLQRCLNKPAQELEIPESMNMSLMTIDELKRICKELGIKKTKGYSKAEFIERIAQHKKCVVNLESMTLQELRILCKSRGINKISKLNKIQLIEMYKIMDQAII